ncbi:hypothetical protein UCRPC4_g05144 [Phaeomoniella chlamydospora]|uniref:Uncharacterized protein n=1 Tax=Phaeomoniella chlamydospora TaxID=158046 RepID=A0A0G2E514_PHACM|nr:hypothetical protein UCRPC4_g05144 [Phaeomoniella chlamydospora]
MVSLIPPPEPHDLLPPLLACLPTAFASARPPPALLPLLSPILRQRLQLLAPNSAAESESWLKLLCWNSQKADKVQTLVELGTWEPHPASGEIEVDNIGTIRYKRFDEETLRAQIPLPDYDLSVVYLWCVNDEGSNGWRVAELQPSDPTLHEDPTWTLSVSEANSASSDRILSEALRAAEQSQNIPTAQAEDDGDDDDDDYWAQYDRTPARTPAVKRSPAPQSLHSRLGPSEDDYYARYASVQPALDATDPSEETSETPSSNNNETTLHGNTLTHLLQRQPLSSDIDPAPEEDYDIIVPHQPLASRSPSSSAGSDTVARLEQTAAAMQGESDSDIAIRQHISTSIKSMYRLAKSTGMERKEFMSLVRKELDVLELLD